MASMLTLLTSEVTNGLFTAHIPCAWPVTLGCHTCDDTFLDCKVSQNNMTINMLALADSKLVEVLDFAEATRPFALTTWVTNVV